MHAPLNPLEANWAYMVMAALAWSLSENRLASAWSEVFQQPVRLERPTTMASPVVRAPTYSNSFILTSGEGPTHHIG